MLDLETLGKGTGCAIVSIAAVPFFKSEGVPGESYFHMNIDIKSCLAYGLTIDPETLTWWMGMSGLFLRLQQDTYHLKNALISLETFIHINCTTDVRVWGRGPSFDNAIMRDAFDRCERPLPWRFSRERCVRTYLCGYEELLQKHFPFTGDLHHPVHDANHQIRSIGKVQSLALNPEQYELD
tara:strand:- start:1216 stop:1761 length:546 start_codon:yes stop_codon:yes gene_type:complete